jgi:hypothetical protein
VRAKPLRRFTSTRHIPIFRRVRHAAATIAKSLPLEPTRTAMRAEIEAIVDEIEQGMALLRRHL